MIFTIIAEILARSLGNFHSQKADRYMSLCRQRARADYLTIWQFFIVKNKLRSVFHASFLLLAMMKFVITLRIHRDGESYFDKVMTKFTINSRTDEWKIYVNLLLPVRFLYQFTVVQSS